MGQVLKRFKRSSKLFIGLTFLSILILAAVLRLYQFKQFPPVGDTQDEVKSVFNGISLIKTGIPMSWSGQPVYKDFRTVVSNGFYYQLTAPWFDEQPLFGILVGSYSILKGMDSIESVKAELLREPFVFLGVLNILLLLVLIYRISGYKVAIISGFIYSTVPSFVIASRLVINENLIVTVMLLNMLFLNLWFKNPSKWFFRAILVLCFIAVQLKLSALFIPVSTALILFSFKKKKQMGWVIGATIVSFLCYLAFGFVYNWQLFSEIQYHFSGRNLFAPNTIINLFQIFAISEKRINIDGWVFWAFISTFWVFSASRKTDSSNQGLNLLLVTLISFFTLFSIMSGEPRGWYRIPFYPLISWGAGIFLLNQIKNPTFFGFSLFFLIPFASSYIFGTGLEAWSDVSTKVFQFLTLILLFFPLMTELGFKKYYAKTSQYLLVLLFGLSIVFNIHTIIGLQSFFWNYPISPYILF